MSPDLVKRIHRTLLCYIGTLAVSDNDDAMAEQATVIALIHDLPPDPGGTMPEPDAGMRFTDDRGCRRSVETATPLSGGRWCVFYAGNPEPSFWGDAFVREVRTPDGRVLWRAS